MSRHIQLREYDRSLLHEPCRCDPKDRCCLPDASGHYGACPRRRAYFIALQQSVAWRRMHQAIRDDELPVTR